MRKWPANRSGEIATVRNARQSFRRFFWCRLEYRLALSLSSACSPPRLVLLSLLPHLVSLVRPPTLLNPPRKTPNVPQQEPRTPPNLSLAHANLASRGFDEALAARLMSAGVAEWDEGRTGMCVLVDDHLREG